MEDDSKSEYEKISPDLVEVSSPLPLLPLRDVVVFPHMVIPLFVGRAKSIKAMEMSMEGGQHILLATQRNASQNEPSYADLYRIGCVANILQMLKLPDGTVKVLVEGIQRAILDLSNNDHKITVSGIATVDVRGGTEGDSHSLRIINSGITTVGFSTYFLFPSGGTPNLPTADGALSMISFTVHRQGVVGLATQLFAGASVNFS